MPRKACLVVAAMCAVGLPASAPAQPSEGWSASIDGLGLFQGDADLDDGGSFSANRQFLRVGGRYRFGTGHSVGLSASIGQIDYDFDDAVVAPWTEIRDRRISLPVFIPVSRSASLLIAPQVRWDYEEGASSSDGQTEGAFLGLAWRVSDSLTIGPALGAFSQLRDSDTNIFPALLIDWDITDRWNLGTGPTIGATQGPGLTLSYSHTDALSFSIAARYEDLEFRLNEGGVASGGVGRDTSVPLVVSVDYTPNPAVAVSLFAGAEIGGQLELFDAAGARVSQQDYDTAPIAGFAFSLQF